MRRLSPFLVLLVAASCAPPSTATRHDPLVDGLLTLMRERLDVMSDVALSKWQSRAPIADPAREAALLDAVSRRAGEFRLDPACVRVVFRAQIEAAKLVQASRFRRWRTSPPTGLKAPDLATDLRPRIDRLNIRLLDALGRATPRLKLISADSLRTRATELIRGDAIDDATREMAIGPLIELAGVN